MIQPFDKDHIKRTMSIIARNSSFDNHLVYRIQPPITKTTNARINLVALMFRNAPVLQLKIEKERNYEGCTHAI